MGVAAIGQPIGQLFDGALQGGVLERGQPPAALADRVMMVALTRDDRLEACATVSHLDTLDQASRREQVEGAIDARDADRVAALSDPVGDLPSPETTVLRGQQRDDRASRSTGAPTGR